jgi:hypothetical protein
VSDLFDLDGNALAARLAVVKTRVLADADAIAEDPYAPTGMNTAGDKAAYADARADTEAVIDECSDRLLGAMRLRRLVRTVVATLGTGDCPTCGAKEERPSHTTECPWPALVAELGADIERERPGGGKTP